MFGKKHSDNGEKIYRYSIRKYHFGAASVAVAALMFFANGVQAQAPAVSPVTASDVVAGSSGNSDGDPQDSDEESPEKTEVVEQPVELKSAGESSAPEAKAEEGSQEESEAEVKSPQPETKIDENAEAPQVAEEKDQEVSAPVADTSAAKSTQSTLEALLANLTLDSMKALHTEVEEGLAKAKAVLENPKATQAQVDEQVKLMEDLTRRVKEALSPQVSIPPVLEKAGLTNTTQAAPEGAVLTPKEAVTKVLEKNPVASTNGEVRTPSAKLSKSEVSDNQNKDKLKAISKNLSAYLIQANEITRPETKKLLEGVEEIVKSIEASVLQPQLTPAEIEELLKKGKQVERKLALALTRENSGKRAVINGTRMAEGSDFRANTTGLSTKRAYIVQKDDGSDLPAETYLYALKRGLNERPQENNLREVREALEEAKVTVQDNGNGDFTWTVRFNSGYKGHQNAFYWFTIPNGHKVTEVLALTRTPSRGGRSSSIGYFDLDREWDAKIKSIVGGDKIGVHGPAKGPHSFNRNFDSLRDVTNTTYVTSAGGTQRVQSEDPVSDKNSSGYYYLGPLFDRFHRIDWSTSVPNEVAKKAARNIKGLHANTNHLYHFTLDSGEVKITYKTHTEDKYAPLYYAAGMRSVESSTANMYFMARGLQEKPNAPTISDNNVGTVTVTPNTEKADKVEISYIGSDQSKKTATLTRNHKDGTWSSNDNGIEVSGNSFTVKKDAVKVGTPVKAKSYFGNSDSSDETTRDILKQTEKPTVNALEDGSVTVTPNGSANYLRISYTDERNTNKTITANKNEGTSIWSVSKDSSSDSSITINSKSGLVTIPATSVADNTKVKAQARANGEALSVEAEATAKNEDRTPPTISVKDGTTWKQGNTNGELTLLADQVNGEIKLNVKIEDNQGGKGFGEFSVRGDNKTVDYSISGGSYNGGSTIFSAFGKDSDATALLTLRLNKKTNGEYDYPSTGFTVTIKARDNSPRQNWTTESSTPKLLKVIVKPRDVVAPVVRIDGDTLPETSPSNAIYTVTQGQPFAPNLEVFDNTGKITRFELRGGNLPDNISMTPFVGGDNFHENTPYRPRFEGSVSETYTPGNYTRTITVGDGNNTKTYHFKYQILPKVPTVTIPQNQGGKLVSTDRSISGTGHPGAKVKITLQDGTTVREVTVENNGKWEYNLASNEKLTQNDKDSTVKASNPISVKQVVNNIESVAKTVDVQMGRAISVSTPVKAGRDISVKLPHDTALFYLQIKNGSDTVQYDVKLVGGNWKILNEDKVGTTELTVSNGNNISEKVFTLHIKDSNRKENIPFRINDDTTI